MAKQNHFDYPKYFDKKKLSLQTFWINPNQQLKLLNIKILKSDFKIYLSKA